MDTFSKTTTNTFHNIFQQLFGYLFNNHLIHVFRTFYITPQKKSQVLQLRMSAPLHTICDLSNVCQIPHVCSYLKDGCTVVYGRQREITTPKEVCAPNE